MLTTAVTTVPGRGSYWSGLTLRLTFYLHHHCGDAQESLNWILTLATITRPVLILNFELASQFDLRPASAPGTCLLIWALGWTQLPSLGMPFCLIQGKWNGFLTGEAHALPAVTSFLAPTSPSHRQQLAIAAFNANNCYTNTEEWVNLRSYSYCHKG